MGKNNAGSDPKILVLMSTYNGEAFVVDQIRSILDQSDVDVTLLVRDDGSKDGTVAKIKEIGDPRISVTEGENLGYRKSFYTLMEQAGKDFDFYAFADQDDIWLGDKLSRAVSWLECYDGPAAYCSSPIYVDEELHPLDNCYSNLDVLPGGKLKPEWILATGLAGLGCTFVWNRELHGIMVRDGLTSLNIGHDNFVSVIAPLVGSLHRDREGRILYRQHTGNASGSKEEDKSLLHIKRYVDSIANLTDADYDLRRFIADNYKDAIGSREYGLLKDSIDYRRSLKIRKKLLANNYATGLTSKERYKFIVRVSTNKY